MRLMLDENVPADMAEMLIGHGHEAHFIRESAAGLCGFDRRHGCRAAKQRLICFDGDFQAIAPRNPHGHRARCRRLSRIWMRCDEPNGAARLQGALDLIVSEFALARPRRQAPLVLGWA